MYVVVIAKLEAPAPGETNAGWQRPGKAEPEPIGISPGGRWHLLQHRQTGTAQRRHDKNR